MCSWFIDEEMQNIEPLITDAVPIPVSTFSLSFDLIIQEVFWFRLLLVKYLVQVFLKGWEESQYSFLVFFDKCPVII